MDGPSLLGADGLPYVFDSFIYDGQVDPQQIIDADDYLSGQFLQGKLAGGRAPHRRAAAAPRHRRLPRGVIGSRVSGDRTRRVRDQPTRDGQRSAGRRMRVRFENDSAVLASSPCGRPNRVRYPPISSRSNQSR